MVTIVQVTSHPVYGVHCAPLRSVEQEHNLNDCASCLRGPHGFAEADYRVIRPGRSRSRVY
jgi:hypothetical protein